MYCYNLAGGALRTEGESHRNTKTLACINRRENTSESIASLRMRKKFSGFPIHQLSWNLVNVRQILANEDTPTTLTFLYETERQPEQTEHILSPAKNVEIKQILKFRKKHLCGIITILTLAWMCDVDRQSHESPAVTKLHEYSIVSVQLTQPVFWTHPNDPSHWLCLYLPSMCVLHHLHSGTSFNRSPPSRTSPLPYLIQRSLPVSHKKRSDLPKGWTTGITDACPVQLPPLFTGICQFSETVFLYSPLLCHKQGYPASPGRPAIVQHCLWPCEQPPTYLLGCFGHIYQSSLLSLIKLVFFLLHLSRFWSTWYKHMHSLEGYFLGLLQFTKFCKKLSIACIIQPSHQAHEVGIISSILQIRKLRPEWVSWRSDSLWATEPGFQLCLLSASTQISQWFLVRKPLQG